MTKPIAPDPSVCIEGPALWVWQPKTFSFLVTPLQVVVGPWWSPQWLRPSRGKFAKGDLLVIQVTLPWPPKQCQPNFKRANHWSKYRTSCNNYRIACRGIVNHIRARAAGRAHSVVTDIAFYPPDKRRRDTDNVISAFKHGQDGVADALGVDDNSFRPLYWFHPPVKGGRVVVTLAECLTGE